MSIRRMMLFTLGGFFKSIISLFKTRVLSDGGTFEAETNLENQLNALGSTLFDSASLVITPNGVKTSKLYTIKPNDSTGDLSVVRNTSATRIDENGNIVNVPANVARIDYSNGSPAILVEPQRTNLVYPSDIATTQARAVTAQVYTLSFYGTGTVTLSGAFSGSLAGTGTNKRVSLTFTPTAGNLTLTVNGSVAKWQLEPGSNATSSITTVNGSVTRNADIISKSGISNLIGQTEGSIYVEFDRTTETPGIKTLFSIYGDGVTTNSLLLNTIDNSTESINCVVRVNSVIYNNTTNAVQAGLNKLMVTHTNSEFTLFLNGLKIRSVVIPSFPSMYNLGIMHYVGIRQYGSGYLFSLWKTKLSDQQAIQLTTL